jgi:crotonobetainyl-CoA:carnitine CoA-transferase CaiB-like acyl-CoA transferase
MSALYGIKVLELGRALAGPWSGQTLADLGAEVVKIEHPLAGDDTRGWGPPYFRRGGAAHSQQSAYFLATNRGKKSVAIDFSKLAGSELVRRLALQADVIIENFRVESLVKYGLDYKTLAAQNPRLIYCSITGFGQTGPRRFLGGYDFVIQALGGLMSVTGLPDDTPGGEPMKVGVPITDLFTGMYATIGILAALRGREQSGRGQALDISLFDVQAAMLANQGMNYLVSGEIPVRLGNDHPNVVPCGTFATADGHIVLTIGNDGQFQRLCTALGTPERGLDLKFRTNRDRCHHRAELVGLISESLSSRGNVEWLTIFEEAKVAAAPVNTIAGTFADPQSIARGLRVELPAQGGAVPSIASPLRLSETPVEYLRAPPHLGEHTNEVLANDLALSQAEIEALQLQGVIRCGT